MGIFEKLFGGGKKNNSFIPSAELMPEEQFWKIIQKTFNKSNGDFEEQQDYLAKELRSLSLQDIIAFENKFKQLHTQAYNWQLWGAIYIIHGGCSDDSFLDFRDWVIAQGQDFYYKTLANPESLAGLDQEKFDIDWEGMGYIPATVFKDLTGQDIPSNFNGAHQITGKEWKEEGDDLKNMFPKLYAKYPDNV